MSAKERREKFREGLTGNELLNNILEQRSTKREFQIRKSITFAGLLSARTRAADWLAVGASNPGRGDVKLTLNTVRLSFRLGARCPNGVDKVCVLPVSKMCAYGGWLQAD